MFREIPTIASLILATIVFPVRSQAQGQEESIQVMKREIQELQREQREMQERLRAAEATEVEEAEAAEELPMFLVYGFFDMNFQQWWLPDVGPARFVDDERSSFVFGNLNLYFDFNPLTSWRFLSEVRLLLNPIGDIESYENKVFGTVFSRVDTTTTVPSNLGEMLSFGSIEIERAQLEWTGPDWLNLTFGLFLTP